MPMFRKKPVPIEARHFTTDSASEVAKWCKGHIISRLDNHEFYMHIYTLEGTMTAQVGDWIIRGVRGEFYPCRADIFNDTYEPVNTDEIAIDDNVGC